jgi:hypothetical protein
MQMNTSELPETLRETAHVQEHRADPSVHTALQEHRSDRQATPRNPAAPCVPGKGATETFVDGAGI